MTRSVLGYGGLLPGLGFLVLLLGGFDGKDPKDPQNRRISIVVVSAATEAAEKKHQKAQPREKAAIAKH